MFSILPKEFLRFYEKPFNFPINQTSLVLLFNLIDYNRLIDEYDVLETIEIDQNNLHSTLEINSQNQSNLDQNTQNSSEQGQSNSNSDQIKSNSTLNDQSNSNSDQNSTHDDKINQIDQIDPYKMFRNNDRFVLIEGQVKQGDLILEIAKKFGRRIYPTFLLYVCCQASKLIVIDQDRSTELKTFYMDKYGSSDIGYQRNQPLFLNEQRLEKFIDEILSGEFSDNLEPLF